MSLVGVISELKLESVEYSALERLKFFLDSAAEPIIFDCARCGAERVLNGPIPDPGILFIRDCTCEDVRMKCESPAQPKNKKRYHYYKPGSLVFAPREDKTLWPGIIEYPPEGPEGYVIQGKTPNKPKAYWVTFIHSWNVDTRWFGGFISTSDIRPIEKPGNLPPNFDRAERGFQQSVERAFAAIPYNLTDRLLEFSFVALAARERRIGLTTFGPRDEDLPQSTAAKRVLPTDEAGPSGVSRKQARTEEGAPEAGPSGVPRKQARTEERAPEAAAAEEEAPRRFKRPQGILHAHRYWKAGGPQDAGRRKDPPDTGSGEES